MTIDDSPSPRSEERELLLRSLDDLDREWESGDLDREDYEALRDDYVARAAALLRPEPADATDDSGSEAVDAGPPRARAGRRAAIGIGLAAFAVLAGLGVARAAGERGVGDQLTGAIDSSPRAMVAGCQEQGATGDLLGALECLDDVLTVEPDNPEALAYRGWYLVLASDSLQASDEASADDRVAAEELLATGLGYLDRSIAADPDYPDPLAFRASVNDRLGRADAACADVEALRALDPPPFFIEQTDPLADRNGC